METLQTSRLRLRPFRHDDAAAYAAYRSDESTARYQSWQVPFPLAEAQRNVAEAAAMDGPTEGAWFSLAITHQESDEAIGDVVARLESNGRAAEVGYSLAVAHRGKGYATEAVQRLLAYLFNDVGIGRTHAGVHPDNVASMRVLERCGFVYEGTARQSYWKGDVCSDDVSYGLLSDEWIEWSGRSTERPAAVTLVEISSDNVNTVYDVATHHSQRRFVAPMPWSFTNALIPRPGPDDHPTVPWLRGVQADGEMVGFVMTAENTDLTPEPYLWRLLIDRRHQHRGIGTFVLNELTRRYRQAGLPSLLVNWVDGHGSPRAFYERYGFVPTGNLDDGEVEARLML